MNSFIETLKGLGPARLAAMAAIMTGILAFFIYLMTRLAAPDLTLLYGELDGQDSGQIVSTLEELKVPYEISPDGSRIFVPSTQVGRLRVAMAEQGLPSGGSIGYEIFDRSEGIGTTNFVQNINRVRALEGEIARTIKSVRSVKKARVHLVLPERQLFSRDQQEASASIVLTLHSNYRAERSQVLAIQQLVASAVPGLKPRMVSIIDSKGNLLARSVDDTDPNLGASNSDELRVSFENRMVRTIEDLLSRSLGAANIRAQVSADMDFDRVTENSEIFDPNGQVVRSTQIVEETSSESEGQAPGVTVGANLPGAEIPQLDEGTPGSSQSTRIEETTNYETSRTTRTHIRESGLVRRLSIAVMVNGKIGLDAEGNRTYEPRTAEEIEQIKALVRSAAGFNEERGDRLEVVNIPFVDTSVEEELISNNLFWGIEKAEIMRLAEVFVLGILAILVLVFVVRPLIQRLLSEDGFSIQGAGIAALPGGPAVAAALAAPDPTGNMAMLEGGVPNVPRLPRASSERSVADEIEQMIDVNKIEGRVRDSSIRKIGEIIQKHPDEAVNILRNWLYQDA